MLEVKAVLILTCREFDILAAYEEWDQQYPNRGPKTVQKDRMYQVERVGSHPADPLYNFPYTTLHSAGWHTVAYACLTLAPCASSLQKLRFISISLPA